MYVTQRYHRGRCGCGRKVVMYSVVAAHVAPENQRSKTVPTVFGASAWLPLFDATILAIFEHWAERVSSPLESLQACDRQLLLLTLLVAPCVRCRASCPAVSHTQPHLLTLLVAPSV